MTSSLEEHLAGLTLDELADLTSDLTLSDSPSTESSLSSDGSTEYFSDEGEELPHSPPRTLPPPPRTPSPPSPSQHLPSNSPSQLYLYSSPGERRLTEDWSEAAHATIGVSNGNSKRLTPRSRHSTSIGAYAVFFGRIPGTYGHWDQAAPLTQNVRRVLFQGYKTLEDAEAAYNYAAARSWTGVCSTTSTPTPSSRLLRHQMPTPIDDEVTISPLHYGTWYTVYKGVEPGVYQSFLECGLHTAGLLGSTYDSADDEATARARFVAAHANGRTRCIPHHL
ncbi:hypothetical protein B0H13DRAFT_2366056 [Mycena leptocephala]|nr:hypothetical protein B0H13DRAFT_2366056 [Mycena leptocephala]